MLLRYIFLLVEGLTTPDTVTKEGGITGIKSVFGNFCDSNTFSKIVALIVREGRIRFEVEKSFFFIFWLRPVLILLQGKFNLVGFDWGNTIKIVKLTKQVKTLKFMKFVISLNVLLFQSIRNTIKK